MKDKYLLRIARVLREVEVKESLLGNNPIFKVDVVLRKKLEDICSDDIFNIGCNFGLDKFKEKSVIPAMDNSYALEYGFKDLAFANPEEKAYTQHAWLRINGTHDYVEFEPEMKMALREDGLTSVYDEEIVAYANAFLHPLVFYLENQA